MLLELKLRKIGNSLGLVLPKEAVSKLNLVEGEKLFISEAPEGSFRLTAANPEFARQMEIALKGMRRYRNTLRELAK